jgi:hypothetical protein
MSSKWAMSGPASAKVAEWKDEDFEDFELVSSGGEPGNGSIEITDSAMVETVNEWTRGRIDLARCLNGRDDAASTCSSAWSSFREEGGNDLNCARSNCLGVPWASSREREQACQEGWTLGRLFWSSAFRVMIPCILGRCLLYPRASRRKDWGEFVVTVTEKEEDSLGKHP